MSSTVSEAGTRTGRARRSSWMVAPGLRVTDMEAKRSAASELGTDALGCSMKALLLLLLLLLAVPSMLLLHARREGVQRRRALEYQHGRLPCCAAAC
jgi:hypothetical protein